MTASPRESRVTREGSTEAAPDPVGRARPPMPPRRCSAERDGRSGRSAANSATLSASACQPACVWIARHSSSQRETTAPLVELRAEFRRDGHPSLVVHRVPVLAGEHVRSVLVTRGGPRVGPVASGRIPHSAPLCATSLHHTAPDPHVNRQMRSAPSGRLLVGSSSGFPFPGSARNRGREVARCPIRGGNAGTVNPGDDLDGFRAPRAVEHRIRVLGERTRGPSRRPRWIFLLISDSNDKCVVAASASERPAPPVRR